MFSWKQGTIVLLNFLKKSNIATFDYEKKSFWDGEKGPVKKVRFLDKILVVIPNHNNRIELECKLYIRKATAKPKRLVSLLLTRVKEAGKKKKTINSQDPLATLANGWRILGAVVQISKFSKVYLLP